MRCWVVLLLVFCGGCRQSTLSADDVAILRLVIEQSIMPKAARLSDGRVLLLGRSQIRIEKSTGEWGAPSAVRGEVHGASVLGLPTG